MRLWAGPVILGASSGFLFCMPSFLHGSAPGTLPGRLPRSPGSRGQGGNRACLSLRTDVFIAEETARSDAFNVAGEILVA